MFLVLALSAKDQVRGPGVGSLEYQLKCCLHGFVSGRASRLGTGRILVARIFPRRGGYFVHTTIKTRPLRGQ